MFSPDKCPAMHLSINHALKVDNIIFLTELSDHFFQSKMKTSTTYIPELIIDPQLAHFWGIIQKPLFYVPVYKTFKKI